MNISELKNAGVDYDDGVRRFGSKPELYEKYLVKFFDDTTFTQLRSCLLEKNYEAAFKCAHTLKGMSGNLSLKQFYDCNSELVEALRNNQTENVMELYDLLAKCYDELKAVILK